MGNDGMRLFTRIAGSVAGALVSCPLLRTTIPTFQERAVAIPARLPG